jgi:segregation and condensation protein A
MIKFKLEKFEGPLSLLLKLIEQEEMDITQISMAKVVDQFVEYIRRARYINPDEMADFLVVAARLLLIKSRALLPYLYPEEEEEIEGLEQQLRMYKEFLQAAGIINQILGRKKFMFAREFNRQAILSSANFFAPPKSLNKQDLQSAFSELTGRLQPPEKLIEETLDHKVNIEDKIISIQQMLINRIKFSFNKIFGQTKNKTEIIVSFLAVLELTKQQEIVVRQDGLFDDIEIKKNG